MENKELLEAIFTASLSALLLKLQSGEATAADLNVARQYLKDNGVGASPQHNDSIKNLLAELDMDEVDE